MCANNRGAKKWGVEMEYDLDLCKVSRIRSRRREVQGYFGVDPDLRFSFRQDNRCSRVASQVAAENWGVEETSTQSM